MLNPLAPMARLGPQLAATTLRKFTLLNPQMLLTTPVGAQLGAPVAMVFRSHDFVGCFGKIPCLPKCEREKHDGASHSRFVG